MRPNFVPLSLAQFQLVVSRYRFKRQITTVHVHHTWRPRKTDYRGISTIQGMWRYHRGEGMAGHRTARDDRARRDHLDGSQLGSSAGQLCRA